MATEAEIRASFAEQARFCTQLGAPFTALLCETLGKRLDRSTAVGRRVLDWWGEPGAFGDAVALRLCGGLHFFARSGLVPGLTALYPPHPLPDEGAIWAALGPALGHEALLPWLDHAPQTNEVGRSAVLMSGLLVIADRFPLNIRLFELGASAGLNLILSRYSYNLGGFRFGPSIPGPHLSPDWEGRPPPRARVRIEALMGVDLNPAHLPEDHDRLRFYVWPDQPERGRRLTEALNAAIEEPPVVDQGDAADWLEEKLTVEPDRRATRVVMHSVAFQYFGQDSQRRVRDHIETVGERASTRAPLAWLRFEKEPDDDFHSLRLRTWPGGEQLLAFAHPHGHWIRWLSNH